LQKEHFKLGSLGEPLQRCLQDFLDIWRKPPSERSGQGDGTDTQSDEGPA
jgi:hypothetical protein